MELRAQSGQTETIGEAQQTLVAVAAKLESGGAGAPPGKVPDKVIEAWKKAVQADPAKRTPRRELARVLRKAQRWNGLVEALKDEEAKACTAPAEKVEVLFEMAEIYRDRLHLDPMVATTLSQILSHDPGNVAVLDQLAGQYVAMKRWTDLVAILKRKVAVASSTAELVALQLQIAGVYTDLLPNPTEAVKAFEAAAELDPDNAVVAAALRQYYEKGHHWGKLIALERRDAARTGDPATRLARTVAVATLASEKLKKPSVSIEAWAEVLALDASLAEALAELEKLYEREKRWDDLAAGLKTRKQHFPSERQYLVQARSLDGTASARSIRCEYMRT